MGKLINLDDYRKKPADSKLVQKFKDSLDNDQVMKRYKINPPEMSLEERTDRLAKSISRINKLMKELEETNR